MDNFYTVTEIEMNRNLREQRRGQPLHYNGDRDEPEFEYEIEKPRDEN
jgi:hypothetical protein